MTTKAGIGYSENAKSRDAGAEAAQAALAETGVDRCDLVIMYTTEKHDPVQFRDGVRSVVGPAAKLIGGYAFGTITKDRLGYDGFQVGVAVLSSDSMKVDMFIEKGLPDNEYDVGFALGKQILSQDYAGQPNILLMYDSVKRALGEGGILLNMATPLIEGMSQALGNWPPVAGLGMVGGMQWQPTFQWFDDRIEQSSAMALVLSGGVRMDTIIMHGCKPSGAYHTITKAEGNVVLEMEGRSALDFIAELLGPEVAKNWEDYPLFVTLGVNHGDKFGELRKRSTLIGCVWVLTRSGAA